MGVAAVAEAQCIRAWLRATKFLLCDHALLCFYNVVTTLMMVHERQVSVTEVISLGSTQLTLIAVYLQLTQNCARVPQLYKSCY